MNPVETLLLENIDKPDSLFVFPTDVAASRWAEHLLRLRGGGSVSMEKFIAWDTFKQNSIRSRKQERRSVPAVLRKIFISRLIRENAELCSQGKPPVFTSLIRIEWAQQAASFASWLAELLPQLGAWFTKTTKLSAALITGRDTERLAGNFDGDDRDLFTLALRYAQFLETHGLFEPAWEMPPFDDTGKECFIFFPNSLSDFSEYSDLLAKSGHVRTITAEDCGIEEKNADVFFYSNSRSEVTEAALYIRALHERKNTAWDSIAVSIPDAEYYEPYVLREFTNRNIPFVKRSGKPLASYPAGRFFRAVADCASRNFAFSALSVLLLNRHLPWKDNAAIQALIDFGINNNCIGSWVEEDNGNEKLVNVWEDAFENPFGFAGRDTRRFFEELKYRVYALRRSSSFAEIRKHYFSFREYFFDMEKCLPETDVVLSRCISELMYLIELEKTFPGIPAPDPYMFFMEYLQEANYLAQQSKSGVVILPYRTAAPAPFDCHVIIGASQASLSAVFSRLGFLPRSKREKLSLDDKDVSTVFINLHKLNSRLCTAFFCAEQTFSGYAIPHSRLDAPPKPVHRYGEISQYSEKFSEDFFRMESRFLAGADMPLYLHQNQQAGFNAWRLRREQAADQSGKWTSDETLVELIRRRFCQSPEFPGKFSVSASSLAPYYQCSLKWLFERVLDLRNIEIDTGLMAGNIAGSVYHAVLNLFFSELKSGGAALSAPECNSSQKDVYKLPETYRSLLTRSAGAVFDGFPRLPGSEKAAMSALTARLLRAEKTSFCRTLEKFLSGFLLFFAGWRVAESEVVYQSELDSGYLNGTVDCILEDTRENSETKGTALIVDFKLKKLPSRGDCTGEGKDGLCNFQLPEYLSLTEKNSGKPVHTALFFSITGAEPSVLFGLIQNMLTGSCKPRREEDRIMRGSDLFLTIMKEFEKKAERFAREAQNGAFSVFPGKQSFEKCIICAYHRVCRTIYKINRDKKITSWGNTNEI